MKDTEILAKLIYRAYIVPDPHAPLEDEALLPFQAVLDLYARTWQHEREVAVKFEELMNMCARCQDEDDDKPCGDSCPITFPEPEPEQPPAVSDPDTEPAGKLDGFEPVPLRAHDTHTHTPQPGPMTAESRRPSSSPDTARAKRERSMRV